MKLNRVLIIFKNLDYVTGRGAHARIRPSQSLHIRHHEEALSKIQGNLDDLGIGHRVIERKKLGGKLKGDLLITIGGDGTFLAASHFAGDIPILGVNSMPGHSIGFFCAADVKNFAGVMDDIRRDLIKITALPTIEIKLDGKILPVFAVNDILFSRKSPAEMTRYELKIGRRSERQRSSGIWIATGAGSTGAIRSAGGRPLGIESKRLQYLVREPYASRKNRYRLLRGILKPGGGIEITPGRDAAIYVDGPDVVYPIMEGQSLRLSISKKTVTVVGCSS